MSESVQNSPKPAMELPVNRAFVVQFSKESNFATGRLTGRIEHVTSGRATPFRSMDEMMGFVGQVLGRNAS